MQPTPQTPNAQLVEERKLENQKRAEQLRAKLLANRANTPIRTNTPNKFTPKPEAERPQEPVSKEKDADTTAVNGDHGDQQSEPSSDLFGIEALLREGKEAAEAKAKAEDLAKMNSSLADAQPLRAAEPAPVPAHQQQRLEKDVTHTQQPALKAPAANLDTEYYSDLALWLEVTGYHDIDYRNSKLRTFKERKALEEEAARIQEKLEKLKQAEQAEMSALRPGSVRPAATPARPPPALPNAMSAEAETKSVKKPAANGTKRAHSPDPLITDKNARHREHSNNGIRIRGANDSPPERTNNRGRAASPLDRRIAYPDARRQNSFGEARGRTSRDPSLERRQAYYGGREGDVAPRGRERYSPDIPPTPRESMGRGRMSFSSVNVQPQERYREPYGAPPRGIKGVDHGRGGKKNPFR